MIVLGGALVVVIGSFLAWATVSAGGISVSASGMDGDGVITLVVGLAAAAMALFLKDRGRNIGVAIAGGIIVLVAIIDIADVNRALGEFPGGGVEASVGIGLWLVLLGGITVLVGPFIRD